MNSKQEKGKLSRMFASVPDNGWMAISLLMAAALWLIISMSEAGGVVFAPPWVVFGKFVDKVKDGTLWVHIGYSLFRVLTGFTLAFIASIPVSFLMGWYAPARNIMEPWIQFVRNIPPLAYIPLVIVGAGVGEKAKVIVIFIACFLILVVTIYQGILNVDATLIRAARVLGAKDKDIFLRIIIPASTPFVFTGARLALAAALTTLVAAELTGASKGLGVMIQKASGYYDMGTVLMGIIIIGIIGITFEQIVKRLERRLTGWQEKIER